MRPRRHEVRHRLRRARHVPRARRDGTPTAACSSSSASHTGAKRASCNGRPLGGFGPREGAAQTELADGATRLGRRGGGSCNGSAADADQPRGVSGAVLGDPVVVDAARCNGELRILDAPPRLKPETGVQHRDVDALGVEHLAARARIEAGRVEVLVVACRCPRFSKEVPALPRPTNPRSVIRRSSTYASSNPLSPFQRRRMPRVAQRRGQPRRPRSGGSHTWPSASTILSRLDIPPPPRMHRAALVGCQRNSPAPLRPAAKRADRRDLFGDGGTDRARVAGADGLAGAPHPCAAHCADRRPVAGVVVAHRRRCRGHGCGQPAHHGLHAARCWSSSR